MRKTEPIIDSDTVSHKAYDSPPQTGARQRSGSAAARKQRRRRRDETRLAIDAAALELLGHGLPFKDLTVESITRAAGITRSAFYVHFTDKEHLLASAAEEVVEALYEQADRFWSGEGSPASRIHNALSGVIGIYARRPEILRAVTEASTYDEEIREVWAALVERFVVATADHIRSEQRAARAADLEPDATADHLVRMVERCCYVHIASGDRSPDALAQSLTAIWMSVLYPGDPRDAET